MSQARLTLLDVCAGAGGQAIGLESAGFAPVALVENDAHACATLRANRPAWNVLEMDLLEFDPVDHPYTYDVDLLAAGLPRVKSAASAARSQDDEARKLLEATVWLTAGVRPRVALIENVPDLVTSEAFSDIREFIRLELEHLGYRLHGRVLNANEFGVPQDRRHGVLVACRHDVADRFRWPTPTGTAPQTVGEALGRSMSERGWPHATAWAARADRQAPAVVGGSKNRGGADLGPSGTKKAWARMGVNGGTIGDEVPDASFPWVPDGEPRDLPTLTVPQVSILQGFPSDWRLCGGKTARYRQIGHAWPPPVAAAVGRSLAAALAER
ncbi:DNA cytosine methyltransferase [Streptomyces purpureus]|uniref:DNA (cytosine-5-)-methyltransferase n=1 Tax=Streptomyces purpureus TaxID=1951 RepID=A0A918LNV0_9ACTN|nr:DNA cytosine methyltransferase [Streptomyces purpureus]GGT27802.1 cytosine-specific methyltransferase [Streptomyces purpureus]